MSKSSDSGREAIHQQIFQTDIVIFAQFEVDKSCSVSRISENVGKILGFDQKDFKTNNSLWHSRIHPDDYDAVIASYTKIVFEKKECECEYRFKHKNGDYIWLRDYLQLGTDQISGSDIINVISKKITGPENEAEGIESGGIESFQLAVNHVDCAFFRTNKNGKIVYLNKAWERVTGFSTARSVGMDFLDYIHPGDRESFRKINDPEKRMLKVRLLSEDGDYKEVKACSFLSADNKNTSEFFGAISDLLPKEMSDASLEKWAETLEHKIRISTKELQNKNALLINETIRREKAESVSQAEHKELELLKSAILHVTEGVVINAAEPVDENGPEILFVNEAYEKMTGFNRDELIGNQFSLLHGPKTDIKTVRKIARGMNKLKPVRTELINYNKNGEPYWVEVNATPIINKDGKCTYWVGIHRNITVRKQIEEKLAHNERRYRALFELSFDAIIQMNLNWEIQDVNESACRIFGYTRDEFLQMSMLDLFPAGTTVNQSAFYSENFLTGDSITKTVKKRKDGSSIAVEVSTRMVNIEGDKQIIAYIRDISEKEKILNDLIRYKNNLDTAQSIAKFGSWELDIASDRVFWSDETVRILGMEGEDYIPSKELFISFIHPDDRGLFINEVGGLERNNKKVDIVYRLIPKHGHELIIHGIGKAAFDDEGNVVKLFGTIQDITEQAEAEQQIQLLTTAVESADDGIVITDISGTVVWVNHAFSTLTGYSREESVGQNLKILNSGIQDKKFYDKLWKTILAGKTWNGQLVNKRKDNNRYVEEMSITPVMNVKGDITNFIAIKRDITEKKKNHLRLEESLREKEVLLAEVHHRVKNNLAMISGLLYLQVNTTMNDEVKRVLSLSQSRIHSIALIHELLYQSETLSTIHFSEFIDRLLSYLKDIYSNSTKDIKIEVEADDIILNVNQAIPSALLINEIVINAYEHAFKGKSSGLIKIQSKLVKDVVSIEVSDNGIGLPGDYDEMVTNTLGLKLIKTLSKQLSAKLENINNPGKGTTFKVCYNWKKKEEPVRLF